MRLRRLGFSEPEIDAAIAQAKAAGLLDDQIFAKLWVEDRLAHHPLSRRAVERELREKGIAPDLISSVMGAFYPEHKEAEIAIELAQERVARYHGLDRTTSMRRTLNFLLRRGFNPVLARKVVREVEKEHE